MSCKTLGQSLRGVLIIHLSNGKGIKAYNRLIGQPNIGLCGTGQLISKGIADEKPIECFAAAIKVFDGMLSAQFFYAKDCWHQALRTLKNALFLKKLLKARQFTRRRIKCCHKRSHCLASRLKERRSANVSSARDMALSSTNSLTERWAAVAAVRSTCLALRDKRRSSFSVLAVFIVM
ncbi:unnamed protein product [Sphagnum jensenii]|uniref:Uncharacterized protein n=1 Tax=Sphagnum jensenii TaxID=128206 RepID=A0ABP0VJA7_9BRYO